MIYILVILGALLQVFRTNDRSPGESHARHSGGSLGTALSSLPGWPLPHSPPALTVTPRYGETWRGINMMIPCRERQTAAPSQSTGTAAPRRRARATEWRPTYTRRRPHRHARQQADAASTTRQMQSGWRSGRPAEPARLSLAINREDSIRQSQRTPWPQTTRGFLIQHG